MTILLIMAGILAIWAIFGLGFYMVFGSENKIRNKPKLLFFMFLHGPIVWVGLIALLLTGIYCTIMERFEK
jgi:hypothetical protein